jgi:hypothetical protein
MFGTANHVVLQRVPAFAGADLARSLFEATGNDLAQLLAQPESPTALEFTVRTDEVAMLSHDIPQGRHSLTGRTHRGHDRRTPRVVRQIGEVEHLLEIATGLVDSFAIGLVDHEDVGDLHETGLVGLHRITPTRIYDDDRGVGLAGDLDFDLSDTNGLDENPQATDRVEQSNCLWRRERKSTEVSARGHRANEHAGIGGVILHAHAIAQNRSTRERRRRIDRKNGNLEFDRT